MRKTLSTIILMLILQVAWTQVGINEPKPSPSAVLELKESGNAKGLLIPRITTFQRINMGMDDPYPANALLTFDTTMSLNKFFFYSTNIERWVLLGPWTSEDNSSYTYIMDDAIGIGIKEPEANVKLQVEGNIKTTELNITEELTTKNLAVKETISGDNITALNNKIIAKSFEGNGTLPVGSIIMWSGPTEPESIPKGWKLCNGKEHEVNGKTYKTPNLSGRFIVGYDEKVTDYDKIGNTGGNKYNGAHEHSLNFTAKTQTTGYAALYGMYVKQEVKNNDKYEYKVPTVDHQHDYTTKIENESTNKSIIGYPSYYVLAYLIRVE